MNLPRCPFSQPRRRRRLHAACGATALLLLLLLAPLAGCYVGPGMTPPARSIPVPAPSALAVELVSSANDARARQGVRRLATDPALSAAAQDFAAELARRGRLTHTSNRAGYTTLLERIDRAGGTVVRAGENVAMLSVRAGMPAEVVRLWLQSEGHRRNLLDDAYTITGAGSAQGADNAWYFVQVYATPPTRR
jgi:uncharacterized protein YkwD